MDQSVFTVQTVSAQHNNRDLRVELMPKDEELERWIASLPGDHRLPVGPLSIMLVANEKVRLVHESTLFLAERLRAPDNSIFMVYSLIPEFGFKTSTAKPRMNVYVENLTFLTFQPFQQAGRVIDADVPVAIVYPILLPNKIEFNNVSG